MILVDKRCPSCGGLILDAFLEDADPCPSCGTMTERVYRADPSLDSLEFKPITCDGQTFNSRAEFQRHVNWVDWNTSPVRDSVPFEEYIRCRSDFKGMNAVEVVSNADKKVRAEEAAHRQWLTHRAHGLDYKGPRV